MSGTADGVRTGIQLTVVDATTGNPIAGAAVYLWLRGVQVADDAGRVAFTSIFPGCYPGRWPHCHFEVYDSLDAATSSNQATKTSQLALPQADCETIYGDDRYGNSTSNLAQLSLATNNVFRDGWEDQLATIVACRHRQRHRIAPRTRLTRAAPTRQSNHRDGD